MKRKGFRKTVFLTGGSSEVGRLAIEGLKDEYDLILLENRREIENASGAKKVQGGLDNIADIAKSLEKADIILHMAACTKTRDANDYHRVNVLGTRNLLNSAQSKTKFLYLSSTCANLDCGVYGRSKYLAEQALKKSGLAYSIIRPTHMYSPNGTEGIDLLLTLARRYGILLNFVSTKKIKYAPIATGELVQAILQNLFLGKFENNTYALTNGRAYSTIEIRGAMEKKKGRIFSVPVPVDVFRLMRACGIPLPFEADRLDRLFGPKQADSTIAREQLGFEPVCFLDYLSSGDWLAPRARSAARNLDGG